MTDAHEAARRAGMGMLHAHLLRTQAEFESQQRAKAEAERAMQERRRNLNADVADRRATDR